jgi:hypothetical protein
MGSANVMLHNAIIKEVIKHLKRINFIKSPADPGRVLISYYEHIEQ